MSQPQSGQNCTCDRERPETFDPACPEHGEGTRAYAANRALVLGRFDDYERLKPRAVETFDGT